jgi:hypothetical protein
LFSIENNNPKIEDRNKYRGVVRWGKIGDREIVKEGLEVRLGTKMMML